MATRMLGRVMILTLLLGAVALAGPIGCGKRGPLEPPKDKPSAYPLPYPAT